MPVVGLADALLVVLLALRNLEGGLLLEPLPLVHLVLAGGANLGTLLGDPKRVPATLVLLRPLHVRGLRLEQQRHGLLDSFPLLLPALLERFPGLFVLGPSGGQRLHKFVALQEAAGGLHRRAHLQILAK